MDELKVKHQKKKIYIYFNQTIFLYILVFIKKKKKTTFQLNYEKRTVWGMKGREAHT